MPFSKEIVGALNRYENCRLELARIKGLQREAEMALTTAERVLVVELATEQEYNSLRVDPTALRSFLKQVNKAGRND